MAYPFDTQYSKRKYTDEQLQKFIDDNKAGCVIGKKKYTLYETSQIMRRIECEIRREKDTAIAAQAAGDEQLRVDCQLRINHLADVYKKVTDASGLTPRRERMTVDGFRQAKKDLISKTLLTSPLPNGTIKEKEAYVRDKVIPNLNTDSIVSRQQIHRQGTKMYLDRQRELDKRKQHGPGYLTITDDEVLELVREFKGKGRLNINEKTTKWNSQEIILTNDKIIGVVVNNNTGKAVPTTVFKIHYSQNGVHIVPDYPSKKRGAKR